MSATPETPSLAEAMADLATTQKGLAEALQNLSQPRDPGARQGLVLGGEAPHARKGEDPLSSRGYMLSRLLGCVVGKMDKDQAKVESDVSNRLQKLYVERGFHTKADANSILVPLSADLICQGDGQLESFARECGELMKAGAAGYDPYEVARLRKTFNLGTGAVNKALSWQDESALGALVAPPLFGELIDILRNNEIFLRAGAKVLPMPGNGRIVFPRQTGVSTAYWVGESQSITDSAPQTGDVTLQAKKLAVLVKIPNELFRFATISVEQFIREDVMRVSALKMDKSLLEATGSAVEPKGLINYSGINTHTASTVATDGNTFEPEDVLEFIAKVEEVNAQFKAFVMRPLMYAAIANRRADAVSAGDKKGMFLFNVLREMASGNFDVTREGMGALNGYPVFKSTQVSRARSKGASSNLSYILGGDFSDYLVAMSGVMEFMVSTQGDTPFTTDQSWIRGTMFADGAPRREASFVFCDTLYVE